VDFAFDSKDLLAFVDETGHHSLSDPAHHVFGVGGCAIPFSQYSTLVEKPWRSLRASHFADVDGPLHAAELQPTGAAVEALAKLFRDTPFYRVAALITEDLPGEGHPYDRCGSTVLAFLHQVAVRCGCARIVLTFESVGNQDPIPSRYLNQQARFSDSQSAFVPVHVFRARKRDRLPGLEIADFVMHAAGCQVRNGLATKPQRKDFRAVFSGVPDSWVYFGLLTGSDGDDAPRLPVV
jgi:hypothetical protein